MIDKAVFKTVLICVTVSVEIPWAVVNWCWDVKMSCTENLNGWDVWKGVSIVAEFRSSFSFTQKYGEIDCLYCLVYFFSTHPCHSFLRTYAKGETIKSAVGC